MPPDHLTVAKAAAALGISDARVRALIRAGRLPAVLFGRQYMIDPKALDAVRVRPAGRPRKPSPAA